MPDQKHLSLIHIQCLFAVETFLLTGNLFLVERFCVQPLWASTVIFIFQVLRLIAKTIHCHIAANHYVCLVMISERLLFLSSMFNAEGLIEGSMYLFQMLCNHRFYVIIFNLYGRQTSRSVVDLSE